VNALDRRPKLAKKVRVRFDRREEKWMLVAPERGLLLNESAKLVVDLLDGSRTEEQIVETLFTEHRASDTDEDELRTRIAKDVGALLETLRSRVLLEPGT
jgi:coenzyme PQQ biosynthesis protein PqqD